MKCIANPSVTQSYLEEFSKFSQTQTYSLLKNSSLTAIDIFMPPVASLAASTAFTGIEKFSERSLKGNVNYKELAKDILLSATTGAVALGLTAVVFRAGRVPIEKLAASAPLVKQELMSLSHAMYYMRLKKVLNPLSRKLEIVYPCIMADVSTPLLATNAKKVIGLDLMKIDAKHLLHYMRANKESLIHNPYSPRYPAPPDDFRLYDDLDELTLTARKKSPYTLFNADQMPQEMNRLLANRHQDGYWHQYEIETRNIDPERLIAIELEKMGVDRSLAQVSTDGQWTVLKFDWAYPGEKIKPREIRWIQSDATRLLEAPQDFLTEVDGLFLKSGRDFSVLHDNPAMVEGIANRIRPKGFIAVGPTTNNRPFILDEMNNNWTNQWQHRDLPDPTSYTTLQVYLKKNSVVN